MSIMKHEFYEGAALHRLIRAVKGARIEYENPFFVLNESMRVYLKYSTGVRSPWAFTFSPEEQEALVATGDVPVVIGLVCGSDGVVALPYREFVYIAARRATALRVACHRKHREHFEVTGPDRPMSGKVAPADWERVLSAN
jgi:hypothetical protein